MAREGGGGGGAFGWMILGVVIGVAGTLAVETLIGHRGTQAEQPSSAATPALAVVTSAPPAPPIPAPVAHDAPSTTPAASPLSPAMQPSTEDVQDDAAAAGMTSRSHPSASDQPSPN